MTNEPAPPSRLPPAARPQWLGRLLVVLLACAAFANTLDSGFTWDDSWLIVDNPRIADPDYPRDLFLEPPLWRPVKRLSLWLDHRYWDLNPRGYHATNLALHAAACLLLHALALRLGVSPWAAAAAAALFAVHPAHVEAVANIAHRKESLALIFCLGAVLAWERGRGSSGFARVLWLMAAAIGYGLAVLSKEAAAALLPGAVLAWELLFRRAGRRRLAMAGVIGLLVVVGLGLLFTDGIGHRFAAGEILRITEGRADSYATVLLTAPKSLLFYASLLVWPWPLYADRAFTLARGLTDPSVLSGGLLVVAHLAAILWTARRAPVACFGLVWYGLHLLPFLNLVPLTIWFVAERFVYLPSAGIALVVGSGIDAVLRRTTSPWPARAMVIGAVALTAVYLVLTVRQNRVWADDATLWQHTVRHNPQSVLGWQGVGNELSKRARVGEAEQAYRRAIAIRPEYADPHYGLALLLYRNGRAEEALQEAELYALARPEDPANQTLIGTVHLDAGRLEPALEAYRRAHESDPDDPAIQFNLANALYQSNRMDEALQVLGPLPGPDDGANQHFLRGRLLERAGDPDGALFSYEQTQLAAPDNPRPINAAALLLFRLERIDQAIEHFRRSLQVFPNQPEVQRILLQLEQRAAEDSP